jgi:penicillin-binding protein 2
MTAVVANNGRPVRPHVVSGVQGVPTFRVEPPVEPGVNAAPASWEAVHLAMRKVVEAGTAGAVRIPGLPVAGKTGTAQNPHGDDHALFVCYAPAVSPTIALAVVAENSGHGGSVSAPIAAHVLKRLFLRDSTAAAPRPPAFASADTVGD